MRCSVVNHLSNRHTRLGIAEVQGLHSALRKSLIFIVFTPSEGDEVDLGLPAGRWGTVCLDGVQCRLPVSAGVTFRGVGGRL